jgi:hypothetical protein
MRYERPLSELRVKLEGTHCRITPEVDFPTVASCRAEERPTSEQ